MRDGFVIASVVGFQRLEPSADPGEVRLVYGDQGFGRRGSGGGLRVRASYAAHMTIEDDSIVGHMRMARSRMARSRMPC